jgi:putative ABC transport system permease protein
MKILWQDLRYSYRLLLRNPLFTAIAVIVLALGIGAATAIFSVVNAVLLRPLPFPDAGRLVQVSEVARQQGGKQESVSFPNLLDWRAQSHSFAQIAAYKFNNFFLTGSDEPERLIGLNVSANFHQTLGVAPAAGRAFLPEADQPGGKREVIISHGLWQRRFGSDPQLIGKGVTLNNETFTVIGVMPPSFQFPDSGVDLWAPLALDPGKEDRGNHTLSVIARLAPSESLGHARTEMDTIALRLEQQYPTSNEGRGVSVVPLHEQLVGAARTSLLILLGAVGCILLIACANVTNLLLSKATTRQKEIAVRMALGASRLRIVRQLLTESLLLSFVGGALGSLAGWWGVSLLIAAGSVELPNTKTVEVDYTVLAFAFAASLLAGVASGLTPALQISKSDFNESLKQDSRGATGGARQQRLRSLLAIFEIALALVLLAGGGLLFKSFLRLRQVDPGFKPEHVLTLELSLPKAKYSGKQAVINFFDRTFQRIGALPGVGSVGAISDIPFGGSHTNSSFTIDGQPPVPSGQEPEANMNVVGSSYFKTMSIPLRQGREFTGDDALNAPGVAVVNEALAQRYLPGESPLGKRIILGQGNYEIVGVVGDVKQERLSRPSSPEIYLHYLQFPTRGMNLVVRTGDDPQALIGSIRGALREIDPNQPIYSVRTMEERLSRSVTSQRFSALLLGVFAGAALLLAGVGIYGVVAYSVTERTHELGIRIALGAQPRDIFRLVVGQGLILILIGVGIGLAAAFALTRLMSGLLYGISPTDPTTFITISLLLAAVALLASYIPARRATKVDPMLSLRYK